MPSIPTGSGFVVAAPAGESPDRRTSAVASRYALATLFEQTSPGEAKRGVLGPLIAQGRPVGTTGWAYTVSAAVFLVGRAGRGAFILPLLEPLTVPTDAPDSTNSRWDRLYAWQPDPEMSDSGVATVGVAKGTPSSSPGLPSLPAGALELGRHSVNPGDANTLAGTITNYADRVKMASNLIIANTLPDASLYADASVIVARPIA